MISIGPPAKGVPPDSLGHWQQSASLLCLLRGRLGSPLGWQHPLTLYPSPFTLSWNLAMRVPGATCRSLSSSTTWGNCPSSDSVPSCSRLVGGKESAHSGSRLAWEAGGEAGGRCGP